MVRYLNRLGLSTTLFLTIHQGQAYQRFKAGTHRHLIGSGWPRPCTVYAYLQKAESQQ